jgi:hypothetical protein
VRLKRAKESPGRESLSGLWARGRLHASDAQDWLRWLKRSWLCDDPSAAPLAFIHAHLPTMDARETPAHLVGFFFATGLLSLQTAFVSPVYKEHGNTPEMGLKKPFPTGMARPSCGRECC